MNIRLHKILLVLALPTGLLLMMLHVGLLLDDPPPSSRNNLMELD